MVHTEGKMYFLKAIQIRLLPRPMENAARGKGITSRHAGVRVSGIVEDDREAKKVYNPDHPDADADGYVTMPNVDVLKETVDSMSATRLMKQM